MGLIIGANKLKEEFTKRIDDLCQVLLPLIDKKLKEHALLKPWENNVNLQVTINLDEKDEQFKVLNSSRINNCRDDIIKQLEAVFGEKGWKHMKVTKVGMDSHYLQVSCETFKADKSLL